MSIKFVYTYNILDSQKEKSIEQENDAYIKSYQEAQHKLNNINEQVNTDSTSAIFIVGLKNKSAKIKKDVDVLQVKVNKLNRAKNNEDEKNKKILQEYKIKVIFSLK